MKYSGTKAGPGQNGFSLVAAIFLIVVLGFLGLMMVTVSQMERETATAAVQGARAYHAARTGVEWGIFEAINNIVATCGAAPSTPTTTNFNLAAAGLNGFAVTVVCSYTVHRERGPPNYNVFTITSTAVFGNFGSPDFVSRTLTVTATDLVGP